MAIAPEIAPALDNCPWQPTAIAHTIIIEKISVALIAWMLCDKRSSTKSTVGKTLVKTC